MTGGYHTSRKKSFFLAKRINEKSTDGSSNNEKNIVIDHITNMQDDQSTFLYKSPYFNVN